MTRWGRLRHRYRERELVRWLADACLHGGDIDGGDMQEKLLELGYIETVQVVEPCGEACFCAEWDDFPQTCYRLKEEWA